MKTLDTHACSHINAACHVMLYYAVLNCALLWHGMACCIYIHPSLDMNVMCVSVPACVSVTACSSVFLSACVCTYV